jgi:hypothetical protein
MKKMIIKIIARVRFYFRWNFDLGREARIAVIIYKRQELINYFDEI